MKKEQNLIRKSIEKNQSNEKPFFENTNKIDKPLARLTEKVV